MTETLNNYIIKYLGRSPSRYLISSDRIIKANVNRDP